MKLVELKNVFEVRNGVNLALNKLSVSDHGIPFVSRTSKNNGVSARVEIVDGLPPNPRHTLSVAAGGSVLATFYQPEPYYSGYHLYTLLPREEMSMKEMLIYSKLINSNAYKYNYGRQANKTLHNLLIPDRNEVKDWLNDLEIMEGPSNKPFYDGEEAGYLRLGENLLQKNHCSWKAFKLGSLFDIRKGKRLTKRDMIDGDIPYIGASRFNNGITEYIGQDPIFEGGSITVSYDGSVGEAFYQPDPFWASDAVNVLKPRFNLNRYSAMFIVTIIKREQYRFSYGRKWKLSRMKSDQIKLPIDSNQYPDWQFMEDYVKSLPYSSNLKSNGLEA